MNRNSINAVLKEANILRGGIQDDLVFHGVRHVSPPCL